VRLLLVCLGGALGSGARYLVAVALPRSAEAIAAGTFPWATFTVNTLGCFAMQLLVGVAAGPLRLSAEARLLLGTGVLGGFTTYSSFNAELTAMARGSSWGGALLYLFATVLGCFAAGLLGALVARQLGGGP
jgi:fluoride exporter